MRSLASNPIFPIARAYAQAVKIQFFNEARKREWCGGMDEAGAVHLW
jgi:hypothetical protein